MSSSWTFGRIGLATSAGGDGLELPPHLPPQWDGDELKLVCDLPAATVADQVVLRDQFNGYDLNVDEPVVPITSSQDSSLDGFYEVVEVNVDDRPGTFFDGGEGSQVTVVARKVPGFASPLFEVVTTGAARTTAHSVTPWSWCGIPYGSTYVNVAKNPATAAISDYPVPLTSGPTTAVYYPDSAAKTAFYDNALTYSVPPSTHYQGAVTVEQSTDSGATWRTVVGRQVTPGARVRLNNGALRTSLDGSLFFMGDEEWRSTEGFTAGRWSGSFVNKLPLAAGATRVTVLRNSPECAAISLPVNQVGFVTLTLRRGAWFVEGVLTSLGGSMTLAVGLGTGAGTSVTAGMDANTAGWDGNKVQLRTPKAYTAATSAAASIRLSSAGTQMPFAVGCSYFEASPITTTAWYFAAMNHRQRVVSR